MSCRVTSLSRALGCFSRPEAHWASASSLRSFALASGTCKLPRRSPRAPSASVCAMSAARRQLSETKVGAIGSVVQGSASGSVVGVVGRVVVVLVLVDVDGTVVLLVLVDVDVAVVVVGL